MKMRKERITKASLDKRTKTMPVIKSMMKKNIFLSVFVLFFFIEIQGQNFDVNNQNIIIKDNIVIPGDLVRYKLFSFYKKELAIVQDTVLKRYGFINPKGDIEIPCIYQSVKDFSEGMAAVMNAETKKWGFINENGEIIAPFIYDNVSSFGYDIHDFQGFKGLAFVIIGTTDEESMYPNGKWGLINRNGDEVIPVKYGNISLVMENMAIIIDGERHNFPIDQEGSSWEFRGKMGFINSEGKIIIPPEYDINLGPESYFEEGTVTLVKNGEEYKFDINGEIIKKTD